MSSNDRQGWANDTVADAERIIAATKPPPDRAL